MQQEFVSQHENHPVTGAPHGGISTAPGVDVRWQAGPLGRNEQRTLPNGAFVETVIAIARDRLEYYQAGGFECEENRRAIEYLTCALDELEARTNRREAAGVEGTHEGN